MKISVALILVVACLVVDAMGGLLRQQPFECQPGMSYVENECNACFCIEDKELVCTLKRCPQNKDKGLEKCATGTSWQKDCNTCWCVNSGTVCSNFQCSEAS